MRECTTGNTACLNDLELGGPCHVVARLLYVIIGFMACLLESRAEEMRKLEDSDQRSI
jgi:hypothetical protein